MKMKILYVISTPIEYSSSANMRNIALIKGLIENGNRVDLLSDGYDINSPYVDKDLCNIKFQNRYYLRKQNNQGKENIKNDKSNIISKVKVNIAKILAKCSIYDNRKILIRNVAKIKFQNQYDLMISSSDPKSSHLVAKKVIKCNPGIVKKWIQYWGDPFATDINKSSIIPKFLIKQAEKNIIKLADEVIYVSPFTLEHQKLIYPEYKNKMEFLPIPYLEEKIYKRTNNKEYTLGYFGDYNSKDRNIIPFYESVKNLNLKLNICGNSDLALESTDKINIFKRQPQNVINKYESQSDLLIVICNKSGTQIPGKVYHYAATNRPILIILDGEEKQKFQLYFEKYNRFNFCTNDEESIEKAIKKIMKEKKEFMPSKSLACEIISQDFIKQSKK